MPAFYIGNQSAYSAVPLQGPFEYALAQGFEAFEWYPDKRADDAGWTMADLDAARRQEYRDRARDAGIRLSVHAPLSAEPLRPGADRELDEALRFAVDLGAGLLVVHFSEPRRCEEYAAAVSRFLQRCSIVGVRLAIENVPHVAPEEFNRLFNHLPISNRNSPTVGMCFDIGHANLYPGTHNDYLAYLNRLAPEVPILHAHLHENYGDRDSHLVLFTGPAALEPLGVSTLLRHLARRGFEGNLILEQWPSPPDLLVMARDRLTSLLPEPCL
ncbi:MAG: sugar phosphate isomerase/epimerase family protein [Gemmataceae bacterium]